MVVHNWNKLEFKYVYDLMIWIRVVVKRIKLNEIKFDIQLFLLLLFLMKMKLTLEVRN